VNRCKSLQVHHSLAFWTFYRSCGNRHGRGCESDYEGCRTCERDEGIGIGDEEIGTVRHAGNN